MICKQAEAKVDESWTRDAVKYPLELEQGHVWLNTQLDRKGKNKTCLKCLTNVKASDAPSPTAVA